MNEEQMTFSGREIDTGSAEAEMRSVEKTRGAISIAGYPGAFLRRQ